MAKDLTVDEAVLALVNAAMARNATGRDYRRVLRAFDAMGVSPEVRSELLRRMDYHDAKNEPYGHWP